MRSGEIEFHSDGIRFLCIFCLLLMCCDRKWCIAIMILELMPKISPNLSKKCQNHKNYNIGIFMGILHISRHIL